MASHETIQRQIDRKKESGDFKSLRLYLRRLLSVMPDEYYLLAELSAACYQLERYDESLKYAHEAYLLSTDDYWVRYIYGCALLSKDKLDEATEMFDSIIACDVNYLANYEHGEGKRLAMSLLNDSRYMRAVIYQQEGYYIDARDLFLLHKNLRRRGVYSDFSIWQVNNHLRTLDVIIGDKETDYSISKYRPQFYSPEGRYTHNEWTSISDIGKSFDDGLLSANDYMKIEKHYIDVAIELAQLSGCLYLNVSYLEDKPKDIVECVKNHPLNNNLFKSAQKIREGLRIPIANSADYLRLCLRECCYARFSNHFHNFYVDFGFDFYMHIRTTLPKSKVEDVVLSNHLYLRP